MEIVQDGWFLDYLQLQLCGWLNMQNIYAIPFRGIVLKVDCSFYELLDQN